MRRVLSSSAALLLAVLAAGCGSLLGLDDDDDTGRSGSSSGGGGADDETNASGGNGASSGKNGGSSGQAGSSGTATDCEAPQVACTNGCCDPQIDRGVPSSIALGKQLSCVTTTTGLVYCWGANNTGQLGQDDSNGAFPGNDANVPLKMRGVEGGATQVSAGEDFVCVLVDGKVSCTGSGLSEQLGDGTVGRATLGVIPTLDEVTEISAGVFTACALRGSGEAWCWGDNTNEQAGGDDTLVDVDAPTQIGARSDYTHLSTGWMHACATAADGVECWGGNGGDDDYRLGIPERRLDRTPIAVPAVGGGGSAIDAGSSFTCAVVGGAALCWGRDGANIPYQPAHSPSGLGAGVTSVCSGVTHACAVQNGAVKCWGDNTSGQLGNSAVQAGSPTTSPVDVAVGGTVTQVSCGADHTCALVEGGTVKCWGDNSRGQLGAGTQASMSASPIAISWD